MILIYNQDLTTTFTVNFICFMIQSYLKTVLVYTNYASQILTLISNLI